MGSCISSVVRYASKLYKNRKFRNEAEKILNYKSGFVIHHLRDTEEQRNFNDQFEKISI